MKRLSRYMTKRLYIKVNVERQVGHGHFMRCVVFAKHWKRQGGDVVVETKSDSFSVVDIIKTANLEYVPYESDLTAGVSMKSAKDISCMLVDGYDYDYSFQKNLKKRGIPLIVIDDYMHLPRYCSDYVINQNYKSDDLKYENDIDARYYCGCEYNLLREEFCVDEQDCNIAKNVRRILVLMGAGDAHNCTQKLLDVLQKVIPQPRLKIKAILGFSNPMYESLKEKYDGDDRIEICGAQRDIKAQYATTDVVITAGGIALWECLSMGKPSIVVVTDDNQGRNARELAKDGIVCNIADISKMEESLRRDLEECSLYKKRKSMSDNAKKLGIGSKTERMISEIYRDV